MDYEEITIDHLDELASLYVETFNSEPWNDKWTISTATKRLHQMINTEFIMILLLDMRVV